MKIVDFSNEHINEAKKLVLLNYNEEREIVPILPEHIDIPDLSFLVNNLGVCAFIDDKMVGFLCCFSPWDNAFGTPVKGTFSPFFAHGTIKENREYIYKVLYQHASKKWIDNNILLHAINLFSHDLNTIKTFFFNGFGLRCIDAIRSMDTISCSHVDNITYKEIKKSEEKEIRFMRKLLSDHLENSPCFMFTSDDDFNNWIIKAETRNSRVFIATKDNLPIAFLEITNKGENIATTSKDMKNICGAYCLPEHRSKNIFQNLLNYTITILKNEGYTRLGVDFESYNLTASAFWLKYFTAYTFSVVRRIDESILQKNN